MKKTSKQRWFLIVGLVALVLALVPRLLALPQTSAMHFFEGFCGGLSIVLLIASVSFMRRSSGHV